MAEHTPTRRRRAAGVVVAGLVAVLLAGGCTPSEAGTATAGGRCEPHGVALLQPAECRDQNPEPDTRPGPGSGQNGCDSSGWGPLAGPCTRTGETRQVADTGDRFVPDPGVSWDWVAHIARHEAGHKAVAEHFGWAVGSVKIRPDGSGLTRVRGLRGKDTYQQIVFYLGGVAATGSDLGAWGTEDKKGDYQYINDLLADYPPDEADRIESQTRAEAGRIVTARSAQIDRDAAVLARDGEL